MIISRTPHRISFFGGGTDYPSWYREHGGKVLGVTIDKYCYILCRVLPPFFENRHKIVYSRIELVNELDEIQHPSVRETLKYLKIERGLVINHDGDIPARSGMGSSSAFTVGLLKALYALDGRIISKEDLFREAIHIEQDLIRENVGSQDQVWAACGGLNTIEFSQNSDITVKAIIMKEDDIKAFESRFLLVFTGFARNASEIAEEQISNIPRKRSELTHLRQLVDEAEKILTTGNGDFTNFGKLLNETWKLKKTLSSRISSSEIDALYETAVSNGAVGGKLLGAGGGGFMVFYAEPDVHERLRTALRRYLCIPFRFDLSGSEIIVYKPDYYSNNMTRAL